MSSSPNSETTHSIQHDVRTFECFGIKFVVNVATETSPAWESKFVNVDGRMIVDWVATDGVHTTSYTEAVTVQDDGFCKEAKNIEVFSTADGPIMGIVFASSPYEHTLLDPCIVQFDHKGSKIDLLPIFNVARKLRVMRSNSGLTTTSSGTMASPFIGSFLVPSSKPNQSSLPLV